MHKHTARQQRRALWGWIKWVPVVAIPFSILFFHAWMNIQILQADYVLRELNAEAAKLEERLEHTGLAETIHEDPEVLAERATVLGFVQPEPGQREIIRYSPPAVSTYEEASPFAIAQRDTPAVTGPAADESQSARAAASPMTVAAPVAVPESAPAPPVPTEAPEGPMAEQIPITLEIDTGLESLAPRQPGLLEQPAESAIQGDQIDTLSQEPVIDPIDAEMGALESL